MQEKKYENAKVAVDSAVFTIRSGKLMVLLHKREKDPFKDDYELPGGLLLPDETAEQTLKRKLREFLGHDDIFFTQFNVFTKPKRDPRWRTVSIGFIALVNYENIQDNEKWFDSDNLPKIAFDHLDIIEKARAYLKDNVNSIIVKQFMPRYFALNRLQEAYEVIEGVKYDNRNFRKKMMTSGIVKETEKLETGVSHRPAKLFRF